MELHEIRYFLAVCETLNFHRAAEKCHVSQPALTRAIHKLEEELGGYLLRRDHHHTQLTDAGRLLRPRLEEVLRQTDAAKRTARNFLMLADAQLTIGVLCTIGPTRVVGFLNDFRQRHSGIGVSIVESVPDRLCTLLLDGDLDVALVAQPHPFDPRLHVQPLYGERFGIAFPVGHALESRRELHVSDVAGEPYLVRINCEYDGPLSELCRSFGVTIFSAYRSEREDWIQAMVAAGMGVCFIPEYSVTHPGVRVRPISAPDVIRTVSVVSVWERELSSAATAFAEAAREYEWSGQLFSTPIAPDERSTAALSKGWVSQVQKH